MEGFVNCTTSDLPSSHPMRSARCLVQSVGERLEASTLHHVESTSHFSARSIPISSPLAFYVESRSSSSDSTLCKDDSDEGVLWIAPPIGNLIEEVRES